MKHEIISDLFSLAIHTRKRKNLDHTQNNPTPHGESTRKHLLTHKFRNFIYSRKKKESAVEREIENYNNCDADVAICQTHLISIKKTLHCLLIFSFFPLLPGFSLMSFLCAFYIYRVEEIRKTFREERTIIKMR